MASIESKKSMLLPAGMETMGINSGDYICFTHKGYLKNISVTINEIYRKIIPEFGLKIEADRSNGLIHFERYDYRFHWNNPTSLIELNLPYSV